MNEFMGDTARQRSVQVPILDRNLTTELAGDFSLPDYQPEIKRLLRIGTNVLPPNRFAGSDGVELNGTVDYFVLYVGNDNGVYCAPLSTDYRLEAESNTEGRSLPITAANLPVCLVDTYAESAVGRVTAPRRLNIRCKLRVGIKLYGECRPADQLPAEDSPEEDRAAKSLPEVEFLTKTAPVNRVYSGLGDVLPLQDDLILSPADGEWRVVCAEGKVLVTEATPAAGQVNCRGEVTLKLTLCPAETEAEFASDAAAHSAPLTIMQRKIPFSQSVELEGVTPACAATACGFCSDVSVEMEEGHVHVDMNVTLEARAQKNETAAYVRDLFSTRRESVCRYTPLPTETALKALNGNFTLSDSLPLSEVGIDPAARIADVTVSPIPEALTADPAKGRCYLSGTCLCHLLLLRDGEYSSAEMTLPFRYEFDCRPSGQSEEPAETAEAAPGFDGGLSVVNCRARMDGERVGIDAELAVSLRAHTLTPLTALTDVSFGDEVTRRRGEYAICFPAPTDTAWSVAKRYHAPMAALSAANNLPAGSSADSPESLEGVGYLIV